MPGPNKKNSAGKPQRVRSFAAALVIFLCRWRSEFVHPLFLRRAAQYFFIRSDTAFRAAADIPRRRRRVDPPPEDFPPRNRSGNARRIAASSLRISSSRDLAPSRASRCKSFLLKSVTHPPSDNELTTLANPLARQS